MRPFAPVPYIVALTGVAIGYYTFEPELARIRAERDGKPLSKDNPQPTPSEPKTSPDATPNSSVESAPSAREPPSSGSAPPAQPSKSWFSWPTRSQPSQDQPSKDQPTKEPSHSSDPILHREPSARKEEKEHTSLPGPFGAVRELREANRERHSYPTDALAGSKGAKDDKKGAKEGSGWLPGWLSGGSTQGTEQKPGAKDGGAQGNEGRSDKKE